MAEEKKSVIVYAEWIELFESLQDEEAGKLIKHFFRYVNDLNPEFPDRITELSFIPIKQTLKRDLKKWSQSKEEKSINGRKGNLKRYYPDIYKIFEDSKITLEQAEDIAKTRKNSLPDSDATKKVANLAVNVNDNVSVNVNTITTNKHELFLKQCLEQPSWLEEISRREKIQLDKIPIALKDFNGHLLTTGEDKIYLKDYKYHFVMWVKKRKST